MENPSVFELIRRFGLDPKKSLGQNYLIDNSHLDRIAEAGDLSPADAVLEVGPGLGVLTRRLADRAGCVVAVELDDRLIDVLRSLFVERKNVTIIHGDILAQQPRAFFAAAGCHPPIDGSSGYKVVANLPYYITSPVLRHLLEAAPPPLLTVVMVQREVAERICAQPGDMSILAVSVQFYAVPTIVQRVPAGAFYPRPAVDSAVLRLELRPAPAVPDVAPERFFRVVRAGFAQKRKQLLNSLSAGLGRPKEEVAAALAAARIDPRRRAETLALAEWGALCRALAV